MSDAPLHDLPGFELVEPGLRDLAAGRESNDALLVSIAAFRLREAGIDVPRVLDRPEERLYARLAAESQDEAHGRYNALIRRIVRFEHAVECASR
jgi:hypothetical protein